MAVLENTPLKAYTATGASAVFAYDFPVLDAADMTVLVDGAAPTSISVSGVGNPAGGTVTVTPMPSAGQRVVLLRDSELSRATDYQSNGDLLAAVVNRDFDRIWLVLQEIVFAGKTSGASVRAPVGEVLSELPLAAGRANRFAVFGTGGDAGVSAFTQAQVAALLSAAAVTGVPGGHVTSKTAFTATAGQAAFTVPQYTPGVGAVWVFVDGFKTEAFAETNATTVTLDVALYGGESVVIVTGRLVTSGVDGSAVSLQGPESAEVPTSAYLNFIETYPVSRWGVDPDEAPAVNRARLQAAFNSNSRRELILPAGDIEIDDLVSSPNGAIVYLTGRGVGVSRIVQTNLTKGALRWDMNFAQGGGVRGLTLTGDVATAGDQGSSGVGLEVVKCNDQFRVEALDVLSFDDGVKVSGGFNPSFRGLRVLYFANRGIWLAPYTVSGTEIAGSRWFDFELSNFGYTGANPENSIGILVEQGSGENFVVGDITQVGRAVVVLPPVGSFARFLKFASIYADSSYYEGWTFDGTSAKVINTRLVDCWSSGSGGGANRPSGSTRGAGLLTKGTNLDDLTWVGGELRDNDVGGWDHAGGKNVRLSEVTIARNSRRIGFDNTYPGVTIRANVSEWALRGCRIGNVSEGVFTTSQAEAIVIEAGTSQNFHITNCDLRDPGAGKVQVVNGSTVANWVIKDNLPIQTAGVTQERGQVLDGTSEGTVAAGATVYIGAAGQQSNESDATYIAARPGLISQVIYQVDAAMGASQSVTVTVRKNGSDTAITGSISGASDTQLVLAGAVTVNAGDRVSIRAVTSAGATVTRHRHVTSIEG